VLVEEGAQLDEESRPVSFEESMAVFFRLIASAVSPALPGDLFDLAKAIDTVSEEQDEDPLISLGRGTVLRHRDWILLDERRERLRRQWATWFETHDVLLCPVVPVAAQPLSDVDLMERKMWVDDQERLANEHIFWPGLIGVAYLPSTVVPVGHTSDGLPVGIQVVGPYLGDLTTLRVAKILEGASGGFRPPPV
jgi:amidase